MTKTNLSSYAPVFSGAGNNPRICMISTHGYVASQPPLGAADTGGQVVYVLELSKKLAQMGYEVDILTRNFEGQKAVDPVGERVRVVRIPCGGDTFIPKEYLIEKLPEWIEGFLRVIRHYGIEYQFINSHYWDAGFAGQKLADVLDVPHVHTPHSLGLWKKRQMEKDYPENAKNFEKQYNFSTRIREERQLYGLCDHLVATTPIQLEMLARDYGVAESAMSLIPPGYDDNRFFQVSEASRGALRQKLGFAGPTILGLGRLARNKGYDLLIKAFAVTARRVPNIRLVIAAGGSSISDAERDLLSELMTLRDELELTSTVNLIGFIPDEDLPDYYRAADMFVLSSRYEPFGMTAIEAMASGTPTVVTTHGGLYRILNFGRHALFADSFDAEDLGIMMMKPFKHAGLRNRLSLMGAHKARSLFTWTGIAQQLIHAVEGRNMSAYSLTDNDWDEPWNDGN